MNDIVRLDANEGRPWPEPSSVQGFLALESARRYPDTRPLEETLARRLGLDADNLVVTAGGDDAIDRAVRAFVPPGRCLLGTEPAFVEYAAAAERARVRYEALDRPPEASFPAAAFARAIDSLKPAIAVLASPDNPGGGVVTVEEFRLIAKACAANAARPDELVAGVKGTILLFDVAYGDFAKDDGVFREALVTPGCVVVGSFSKAWGLAGLRVGWAAASAPIVAAIRKAGPPYSVARPSLEAALAALETGEARLKERVERTRRERLELESLLRRLGADCWPGEANFAALRARNAPAFVAALAARGVLVRSWPRQADRNGLVRITCPCDEAEFGILAAAVEAAKEFL